MKIIRENKEIVLSNEELEAAYRERQHEYLMSDAKKHCEDYLEQNDITLETELCDDDYESLVEGFHDSYDCNLNENDIWESIIDSYMQELVKNENESIIDSYMPELL